MNQDYPEISYFDREQVIDHYPSEPVLSSDGLGWDTIGFNYFCLDSCELPESVNLEHGICMNITPSVSGTKFPNDRLEYRQSNTPCRTYSKNSDLFMILPSGSSYWPAWQGYVEFISLAFAPKKLSEFAFESINPQSVELVAEIRHDDKDYLLEGIFLSIKNYLKTGSKEDDFYIEYLENLMYAHLLKNYCTVVQKLKHYNGLPPFKLKLSLDYIHSNLSVNLRIKEIAKLLEISPGYFSRLFKESMGVSPYHYIQRKRLEKAQKLLRNSDSSLIDVAAESGFTSQSKMTHYFSIYLGITPRKYRNSL